MSYSKLIFLTNTITNYQYSFFDKLNKVHDIKVIVIKKKIYKNYNFSFPKKSYIYFLENYENKKKKILSVVNNFKPNKIIFCGYRLKYILFIKKIIFQRDIKHFFWLERINNKEKLKIFLIKKIMRFFLKGASGIFSVGLEAKKFYLKFNKNVINIPYSIPIPKKIVKQNNKIKFLFCGQLIKRKGVDLLLKALRILNLSNLNYEFMIIGNGKYKSKIKELIKENHKIKYKSFLNQKLLMKYFRNYNVLIFPSRFDGWGVVPMQAMSNSMYIIIGENCGVNEIFIKKRNNLIIKPDANSLFKAITFIFRNKNRIIKDGIKNYTTIKNSICNLDNSIKSFNKIISQV